MMRELDSDFQSCLKRHKIQAFADGPRLTEKELARAAKNLGIARGSLTRGEWEWATAQAYYAAFLAARAMILVRGYRETGSHICLWTAVRALFVSTGEVPASLIDRAALAKRLREDANYEGIFSQSGAESAIRTAEELVGAARRIMGQARLI
jgi:uncharacterized protein (UPF0332 family)